MHFNVHNFETCGWNINRIKIYNKQTCCHIGILTDDAANNNHKDGSCPEVFACKKKEMNR